MTEPETVELQVVPLCVPFIAVELPVRAKYKASPAATVYSALIVCCFFLRLVPHLHKAPANPVVLLLFLSPSAYLEELAADLY